MKTRVGLESGSGIIDGTDIQVGDWGVIVEDKCVGDALGHIIHGREEPGRERMVVLDMTDPPIYWGTGEKIKVRLLAIGESITITRTE